MALTRNFKRIGMAAHNERRDQRDMIDYQQAQAAKKKKAMQRDVYYAVRYTFETQEAYDAWWEAAPEIGFFEYSEAYLLDCMAQDRNNILVTRRDSLLAAMREEAMSKETALEIIDELAEIEKALQAGGYVDPTGAGWFDFEKIEEIEL